MANEVKQNMKEVIEGSDFFLPSLLRTVAKNSGTVEALLKETNIFFTCVFVIY